MSPLLLCVCWIHSELSPWRRRGTGYFKTSVQGIAAGQRYILSFETAIGVASGSGFPGPAEGVHGPSIVVDPTFRWTDELWRGVPPGR